MLKKNSPLLVLEFGSIGEAYKTLQLADAGLEVIELMPLPQGSWLLMTGSSDALRDFSQRIEPAAKQVTLLPSISESIANSYWGLLNPPLKSSFVSFESTSPGAVFTAAIMLEAAGWEVFDLRLLRGGAGLAYLFATSEKKDQPDLSKLNGKVAFVPSAGPLLKNFFEIQPS